MGDETAIVKAYAEKADEIVKRSESLVIHNQQEREFVATIALEARFVDDEAEKREKEITKPLNEALKKVRELFKDGVRTKCDLAQDKADNLLKKDWLDFEDARIASQRVINASKKSSGSFVPNVVLPETEKTIETPIGKITMRRDIKVSVPDGKKMDILKAIVEAKIPMGFAEIDLGYVKKYAKLMNWPEGDNFGILVEKDCVVTGRK